MALRATVVEGKGTINPARLSEYRTIMKALWDEISALADFDKVSSINRRLFQRPPNRVAIPFSYSTGKWRSISVRVN